MSNSGAATGGPSRRARSSLAVLICVAGLLPACGGDLDDPPVSTSPAQVLPSGSPPAGEVTGPPTEFVYAVPGSACPKPSELLTLPPADEPYELDERLHEERDRIIALCTFQRFDWDLQENGSIPEEHVLITSYFTLFEQGEDAGSLDALSPLPVASGDLLDWRPLVISYSRESYWEGCGPRTPCSEGDEPTYQTKALISRIVGHVGNLRVEVQVNYIAESLPPDVEDRSVQIAREVIVGAIDRWKRVTPSN